ncbi:hypothetical protein BDD43_4383 [Mucilaginibacter gracilis]|uniref:Uncharacterized protein n=1 Tax=Mucilaginibacter gracilis TaxID=423350 RepID=A0A495J585_9SPHI|nr:hypothetical protein [Mucilaginibacter gracilis]RKR84156.1 hypothetical protein BDD43_4383 [Mucilaginibacter gracilis]
MKPLYPIKRMLTLLFLGLFLVYSNSALLIMGSFYLQRDYIARNLCVNRFASIPVCLGRCFLNKELKEDQKKEQSVPNAKQKELQVLMPGAIDDMRAKPGIKTPLTLYLPEITPCLIAGIAYGVFHPPRAC